MKSILSAPISSWIDLSVKIVPKDGLHKYQSSLSLISSTSSCIPHSAQPAFSTPPSNTLFLKFTNTVPALKGVGGVPQNIV